MTTPIEVVNLPGLEVVFEWPLVVGTEVPAHYRACRRWVKQGYDHAQKKDRWWWRYYIGVPRVLIDPVPDLRELAETTPFWGITANRFPGDDMQGEDADYYYYIQPITQNEGAPIPEDKLRRRAVFFHKQGSQAFRFLTK